MNIVDVMVKKMMLRHFSIFPTRMHVLNHMLLCIGNGFEWYERDGLYVLDSISEVEELPIIHRFETDNPHFANERDEQNKPFWQANLDYQNLIREWASKNIDLICQAQFSYYGFNPEMQAIPYSYCKTYSKMVARPKFELIHQDWVEAMRQHAFDVMYHIRSSTNHTGDNAELLLWLQKNRQDYYEPAFVCLNLINDTNAIEPFKSRSELSARLVQEVMSER